MFHHQTDGGMTMHTLQTIHIENGPTMIRGILPVPREGKDIIASHYPWSRFVELPTAPPMEIKFAPRNKDRIYAEARIDGSPKSATCMRIEETLTGIVLSSYTSHHVLFNKVAYQAMPNEGADKEHFPQLWEATVSLVTGGLVKSISSRPFADLYQPGTEFLGKDMRNSAILAIQGHFENLFGPSLRPYSYRIALDIVGDDKPLARVLVSGLDGKDPIIVEMPHTKDTVFLYAVTSALSQYAARTQPQAKNR